MIVREKRKGGGVVHEAKVTMLFKGIHFSWVDLVWYTSFNSCLI